MKTRIKVFTADAPGSLESKVNGWIADMEEKDGFEIVNTLQNRVTGTTVFTIVYKVAADQKV